MFLTFVYTIQKFDLRQFLSSDPSEQSWTLLQTCDFRMHSPLEQVASSGPQVTRGAGGGVSAATDKQTIVTTTTTAALAAMLLNRCWFERSWDTLYFCMINFLTCLTRFESSFECCQSKKWRSQETRSLELFFEQHCILNYNAQTNFDATCSGKNSRRLQHWAHENTWNIGEIGQALLSE